MSCLVSCCSTLCGPSPFEEDTNAGDVASIAKILVVGLLAIAALSVGLYYCTMAWYQVWNPFDFSLETQMNMSIIMSSIFGSFGLIATIACLIKPILNIRERQEAE